MQRREECPECGTTETRREWVEWQADSVVEIRTCGNGHEYNNHLGLSHQEVTHGEEDQ